ncbi:MAG TPA: regulatory protein RecX [Ignavibacteria bacterium]|nr:regulatory protein RecX [Ignavibacteria bacterium]
MKIERIIRKNDRNVIVHLENGEKLFLAKEVVLKNGLRKGDQISDDLSSFLINENQLFFIKQRAFSYLGRRFHSRYELTTKLKSKGYASELINTVLNELEDKNYLNDYEFAVAFAKDKLSFKHFGSYRIRNELIKRRVNKEIIEQVISEIFPEGNDLQEAVYHINKKLRNKTIDELDDKNVNNKLITFLIRKGFDFETAKTAIEEVKKGSSH